MKGSKYGSTDSTDHDSTAEQSVTLSVGTKESKDGSDNDDKTARLGKDSYTIHINPEFDGNIKYNDDATKIESEDNKYTIELSNDVFSFVLANKVSGIFDRRGYWYRVKCILICLGIGITQFALLGGVAVSVYLNGETFLGKSRERQGIRFAMKILASGSLALYYVRDMRSLLPIYMVKTLIRENKRDYKLIQCCLDCGICCNNFLNAKIDLAWIWWFVVIYQWALGVGFLISSLIVVGMNKNVDDIIFNCLAVTFIMEIDDWAFDALTFNTDDDVSDLIFEFDFIDNNNNNGNNNNGDNIDDGIKTAQAAKESVIEREKDYRRRIVYWAWSFCFLTIYVGMILLVTFKDYKE